MSCIKMTRGRLLCREKKAPIATHSIMGESQNIMLCEKVKPKRSACHMILFI